MYNKLNDMVSQIVYEAIHETIAGRAGSPDVSSIMIVQVRPNKHNEFRRGFLVRAKFNMMIHVEEPQSRE